MPPPRPPPSTRRRAEAGPPACRCCGADPGGAGWGRRPGHCRVLGGPRHSPALPGPESLQPRAPISGDPEKERQPHSRGSVLDVTVARGLRPVARCDALWPAALQSSGRPRTADMPISLERKLLLPCGSAHVYGQDPRAGTSFLKAGTATKLGPRDLLWLVALGWVTSVPPPCGRRRPGLALPLCPQQTGGVA